MDTPQREPRTPEEKHHSAVTEAQTAILDSFYKARREAISKGRKGDDVEADRAKLQKEVERDHGIAVVASGAAIMSLIKDGYLQPAGESGVRLDHSGVAYCENRESGG